METRSNPLGWPAWLWRCLVALMLAFSIYVVDGSLSNLARAGGLLHDVGPPGFSEDRPVGTPVGWTVVADVVPGLPAAEAGLKAGDLVRSELPLDTHMQARTGWPHPLTVERSGARFRTSLVIPPRDPPRSAAIGLVLWGAGSLATLALALLLLVRARHNRAAVMLAVVLLSYAIAFLQTSPWAPGIMAARSLVIVQLLTDPAIAYFKLMFALEIAGGAADRGQARLVHAAALTAAALQVVDAIASVIPAPVPLIGPMLNPAIILATNALIFGIIGWNYRSNDASARNRIKIVALALFLYPLSELIRISLVGTNFLTSLSQFALPAVQFAGLLLLAHAVLKQRLFDLNFALNRTLVYATVSFVLLAAFGLAKWVIEHLIPESWHAGSEYYSVGIALVLFLVLHRVHNSVERNVERFLFSPWHRNEETLRRFVTAAGHFDQTETLCAAFTQEASRFAKGAGAAQYARDGSEAYSLQCGSVAEAPTGCSGDDLALALMRAERQPVKIIETRTALPGALALPMLDHGKLAGFLLLDRKPDGTDYRPDEIEVLGWATQQVGLDLQAIRASELEAENARLKAKVADLSARKARARHKSPSDIS